MINDKIKKEIKDTLKECIREKWSYDYSGVTIKLIYDSEFNCFDIDCSSTNSCYPNRIELLELHTTDYDWFDFLQNSFLTELKLMVKDPNNAEFLYNKDIIKDAKNVLKNKKLKLTNISELGAKHVLETCGASDFIQNEQIKENIDYSMEQDFARLLNIAIKNYENKVLNKNEQKIH